MEQGLSRLYPDDIAPVRLSLNERIEKIRQATARLSGVVPAPRQEWLSGVHNPWGHAVNQVSAWPFLDICESSELLERVTEVVGPDVILWDSELFLKAEAYHDFLQAGREGRYWPATPLSGAVVLIGLDGERQTLRCIDVNQISSDDLADLNLQAGLYVIRYMSGSSHFDRDVRAAANWVAMQEQTLINYTSRPLWLVAGKDRGSNDFVTGFSSPVPMWVSNQSKEG